MLGLAAGGGSPALLPRVLPPGKAMQMLMTGDPISAQEAQPPRRHAQAWVKLRVHGAADQAW